MGGPFTCLVCTTHLRLSAVCRALFWGPEAMLPCKVEVGVALCSDEDWVSRVITQRQ